MAKKHPTIAEALKETAEGLWLAKGIDKKEFSTLMSAIKVIEKADEGKNAKKASKKDFLAEVVQERTAKNSKFPKLVKRAEAKRKKVVKPCLSGNQRDFDKVVTHLAKQYKRSEGNVTCAYRSKEGLKCAIGCLIPDSLYSKNFEEQSVDNLPSRLYSKNVNMDVLSRLQRIHDGLDPSDWKSALIKLGKTHKLDTSKVVAAFKNYGRP